MGIDHKYIEIAQDNENHHSTPPPPINENDAYEILNRIGLQQDGSQLPYQSYSQQQEQINEKDLSKILFRIEANMSEFIQQQQKNGNIVINKKPVVVSQSTHSNLKISLIDEYKNDNSSCSVTPNVITGVVTFFILVFLAVILYFVLF